MSDIDLTPVNSGLLEVSKAISKLTPVGAGTVTDVSVVTANGVSGSVATSTTTPAITLSLGAITPSTVAIGAGAAITSSGAGGALGTAAFTAATAYDAAGAAAAVVSDTAYDGTTWDGVTTIAPSKNAVRDKIQTLAASGANSDITSLSGVTSITGGAGNMTILSGTGASRTMTLQTTNSGSTPSTVMTLGADQTVTTAGNFKVVDTSHILTSDYILWGGKDGLYLRHDTAHLHIGASDDVQMIRDGAGIPRLSNAAGTGFTRLNLSVATNSGAAVGYDAVNGITLQSAAGTATWNDASTAASGTVANRYLFGIAAPTLTATNATVTDTVASTVYIGGAPSASTNTTIGTAYALNVAAGTSKFGGPVILPAGTTVAGTAPLKFTTQASPLTVVEQGTMELVGNSLQFTQKAKRRGVAMTDSTLTADVTWAALANGTTESGAVITSPHGAGYLEVGKMEEIVLVGTLSQRSNANAVLTTRVKYAGSTILTFATPNSTAFAANSAFLLRVFTTCRTTGALGTMQINAMLEVNGTATDPQAASLASIDTTTAQDTTVTFQWGTDNDVANTVTINQGRVLCVEPNR